MIRRRVYYDGRVQGVGFRATTAQIASNFPVRGTVRNLDDGRVELVVEGQTDQVDAFLERLRATQERFIQDEQRELVPLGEPFPDFRVIA